MCFVKYREFLVYSVPRMIEIISRYRCSADLAKGEGRGGSEDSFESVSFANVPKSVGSAIIGIFDMAQINCDTFIQGKNKVRKLFQY